MSRQSQDKSHHVQKKTTASCGGDGPCKGLPNKNRHGVHCAGPARILVLYGGILRVHANRGEGVQGLEALIFPRIYSVDGGNSGRHLLGISPVFAGHGRGREFCGGRRPGVIHSRENDA